MEFGQIEKRKKKKDKKKERKKYPYRHLGVDRCKDFSHNEKD